MNTSDRTPSSDYRPSLGGFIGLTMPNRLCGLLSAGHDNAKPTQLTYTAEIWKSIPAFSGAFSWRRNGCSQGEGLARSPCPPKDRPPAARQSEPAGRAPLDVMRVLSGGVRRGRHEKTRHVLARLDMRRGARPGLAPVCGCCAARAN